MVLEHRPRRPVRRLQPDPPLPDFQFPQVENPQFAPPDWQPHIVDYLFVSFTNSIAFSPTDTFPLTRRTKMLMLSESFISAVTVLLVASRAVGFSASDAAALGALAARVHPGGG